MFWHAVEGPRERYRVISFLLKYIGCRLILQIFLIQRDNACDIIDCINYMLKKRESDHSNKKVKLCNVIMYVKIGFVQIRNINTV